MNERIRELRVSRNISQVELAKALGVSKQSVSNWENDNILPSIELLVKLSNYFSVSTDDLLGLSEKEWIDVSGLTQRQIEHIKLIVEDIKGGSQQKNIG